MLGIVLHAEYTEGTRQSLCSQGHADSNIRDKEKSLALDQALRQPLVLVELWEADVSLSSMDLQVVIFPPRRERTRKVHLPGSCPFWSRAILGIARADRKSVV